MDRKVLIILALLAIIVVAGGTAWARYQLLQHEVSDLRDERQQANENTAQVQSQLEQEQDRHAAELLDWETRLSEAAETINEAQEALLHSQERESILRAQEAHLRADLEEVHAEISEMTGEELLVKIPVHVAEAYPGDIVVVGVSPQPGLFQVDRPGLQSWDKALTETLSLRDLVGNQVEIVAEKEHQIASLFTEIGAREDQAKVWMDRTVSTEKILSTALDAKVALESELEIADRQIGTLEEMVYFKWWPEWGVTCGVGFHGQGRAGLGCMAGPTWRLRFK